MSLYSEDLPLPGKPFLPQTPGRVQYYMAEFLPYLKEKYKWEVRQQVRRVISEESRVFIPKVEREVLGYLNENYPGVARNIDLDLTLREAEYICNASTHIKDAGKSGKLQSINEAYDKAKEDLEVARSNFYGELKVVENELRETEDNVLLALKENFNMDFTNHRRSVLDLAGDTVNSNVNQAAAALQAYVE